MAFAAALLITLAYAVWVLSLPCFPSADGPVHMYYVQVMGTLLAHTDSVYARFFSIRHLLPPYSLYYYGLLLLSRFVPMLLADRVILCVYLFSFVLGFRYLARAVGPSADVMTLLATILLLNWPLGMGFVNFCLSLSLCFWATGLWLRLLGRRNPGHRALFVLLVTASMLTHPVPLMLVLAVAGVLLAVHLMRARRTAGRWTLPPHGGADLLTLGVAALNLGYVKLFAIANPLRQTSDGGAAPMHYWRQVLYRLGTYAREDGVAFVLGRSPGVLVYRLGLLAVLAGAAFLAVRQRQRNRAVRVWAVGDTFLGGGVLLLVALPLIPAQLNGSYYFADRLVQCVWLAFLLAASGYGSGRGDSRPVRTASRMAVPGWNRNAFGAVIAVTVACNGALLIAANRLVRPAAMRLAALRHVTVAPPGQVGFLLEDPRPPLGGTREGVSWNPEYWALVHLFRESDAVLANAPWAAVTILPVGPSSKLPEVSIRSLQQPLPTLLQGDLLRSPADLQATLAAVDFFAVNQFDRPPLDGPEPLLQAAGLAARGWACRSEGWYRICSRPPVRFEP